jgi:hypothetical protein
MATVNLGRIKFVWQGAYSGATAYVADDVVSYNGSSYICILASTGNLPTNTTYWSIMSSAGTNGTNGTDINAIAGLQAGDILTHNGTSFVRLAKGTASQVLRMNSGATALEYGTVSSDVVKLIATETNTSHATIDMYGYFDDTVYDHYFVKVEYRVSGSGQIRANWLTSSASTELTSNYYMALHTGYTNPTSGQQDRGFVNQSLPLNDMDGTWGNNHTSSEFSTISGILSKPQSTTRMKIFDYEIGTFSTSNIVKVNGILANTNTTQCNGFRFKLSTGNFDHSKFALYGFKK